MKLHLTLVAFLTTITFNSLAMQTAGEFDFSAYLKTHSWHERLEKLAPDQRSALQRFIGTQHSEEDEIVPESKLAPILMQGLDHAEGKDILHQAVLDDSDDGVRRAVQAGADVHRDRDGKAPLLWATLLRKSHAVEGLLVSGAKADVSYLHHAVRIGDIKSAISLVQHGAPFDGNVDTMRNVMDWAIIHVKTPPRYQNSAGKWEWVECDTVLNFVQLLIDKGWDVHNAAQGHVRNSSLKKTNVWWETIPNGWQNSSIKLMELFLKNRVDPNQTITYPNGFVGASWTPLLLAIGPENLIVVKLLLQAGADVNKKAKPYLHQLETHSPLSYAMKVGCQPAIELLLQKGAKL